MPTHNYAETLQRDCPIVTLGVWLRLVAFGCVWLRPHVQRRQAPNTQSARTPAVARSVREFIAVWLRLVGCGCGWLQTEKEMPLTSPAKNVLLTI